MKLRLLFFIVFQTSAWFLYFNWEGDSTESASISQSSKIIQVVEVNSQDNVASQANEELLFQLVLRNDGFFTKVNDDQSTESGIWRINYDIPSIILKSPVVDYKYRILDNYDETLHLELLNSHEILEARKPKEEASRTLFSSFKQ